MDDAIQAKSISLILSQSSRFISHILGQEISIDLSAITPPFLKDLYAHTLKAIDFNQLGLVSLKEPLSNADSIDFEPDAVVKLSPLVRAEKFDNYDAAQPSVGFKLLETITDAQSKVVDAYVPIDNLEKEIKELLNEDQILQGGNFVTLSAAERKNLVLLPKLIKEALVGAHSSLGGLYVDIINDASALAGLNARTAVLENADIDFIKESIFLRSELKRVLAARKRSVQRLEIQAKKTIESIRLLIVDQDSELAVATIVATLVEFSQKKGLEQDFARQAKKLAIDLGDNVSKACDTLLESAQTIIGKLDLTFIAIEKFLSTLLKDHAVALSAIQLTQGIQPLVEDVKKLRVPIAQGSSLVVLFEKMAVAFDTLSQDVNLVSLEDYFREIESADFETELDKISNLELKKVDAYLDVSQIAERAVKAIRSEFENQLFEVVDPIAVELLQKSKLQSAYAGLLEKRTEWFESIGSVGGLFEKLFLVELENVRVRTSIPNGAGGYVYERPVEGGELKSDNDRLAADTAWLKHIEQSPVSDVAKRKYIGLFFSEWGGGRGTPVLLIENLFEQVRSVLRGDVDLLEFFNVRQEIETYLLNLVPTKYRYDLALDFPLPEQVKDATAGIFIPGKECRLNVGAETVIDLLPTGIPDDFDGIVPPKVTAKALATLGRFDIKLVGDIFDAVTLKFAGARFVSDLGKNSDFKLAYDDFVIGKQLEFIQELQSYMTPDDGSGVFVQPLKGRAGIEAGYGLSLGTIMLGNAAFANISLNASAILPFDGGADNRALFKASLSRRDAPFTISYIPYGGSGYLAITADAKGIRGFEMSLEFGAAAPFKVGPLTGIGRIMAGFYIRHIKLKNVKVSELTATFYEGGSASIWVFNFSASLYVRLGHRNGTMYGLAIFTFSFSMGIADFDFTVRFEKTEGKGMSGAGGSGEQRTSSAGDWLSSPQSSWGVNPRSKDDSESEVAMVETTAQCQSCDWKEYRSYFDRSVGFDI